MHVIAAALVLTPSPQGVRGQIPFDLAFVCGGVECKLGGESCTLSEECCSRSCFFGTCGGDADPVRDDCGALVGPLPQNCPCTTAADCDGSIGLECATDGPFAGSCQVRIRSWIQSQTVQEFTCTVSYAKEANFLDRIL